MQLHVEQVVEASVEALFDIVSDPALRTQWQSSLRSVQPLTPGPPGVGTRWREVTKARVAFDMEISRFERPSCWAEVGHNAWSEVALTVHFKPVIDSPTARTSLSVDVSLVLRGVLKLAAPILALAVPPALRADLQRAASLVRQREALKKP